MNGPIYNSADNTGLEAFAHNLATSGLTTFQLRNFSNEVLGRGLKRGFGANGYIQSRTKGRSREDISADIAKSPEGIAWFKNVRQLVWAVRHEPKFRAELSKNENQLISFCRKVRMGIKYPDLNTLSWKSLVIMRFSSADIDAVYRKVEPKIYGEQVLICDLETTYRRKRERQIYDKTMVGVLVRTKTGEPTTKEIEDAYKLHVNRHRGVEDSKKSEAGPMDITISAVTGRYIVQPQFNWAQRAHFGSSLSYMSITPTTVQISAMEQLNTNSERKCAYLIVSEDLKMTEAEISEFVGKPVDAGLTPVDLRSLYASRNASLYLFDLNSTIIDSVTTPADKRDQHRDGERVFLIILANEHAFRPGLEMRETLMKVTPEKRPEPKESKGTASERDVIYRTVDSYWEAEELGRKHTINYDWRVTERYYDAQIHSKDAEIKTIWTQIGYNPSNRKCRQTRDLEKELKDLKKTKERAVEFSKLEARRDQPIVNIYVTKENLNAEYKSLVCDLGYVYASNIDSQLEVTHIKYSEYVNIYANTEPVELQTTAGQLGINYANQTIPALGRKAFKTFRKSCWESSILSTAMTRLLELFPASAWNRGYIAMTKDDEEVAAVDFFRNYTSIAMSGDFYTAPLMADLVPYDGHAPGEFPAMYYIETKEAQLFDGNGVYDYQVVSHGIALGLITPECIKLYIKCNPSPVVDATLKKYIEHVYAAVTNDSHRKALVNTLIGSFGTMHKFGKRKAFVVDSLVEASYYYRTNDTTHPRIAQLGYIGEDPVYVATAEDMVYRRKSDELIRRAIVQRGRMHTYDLMLAVSKQFQVVQIKTDAVYYIKQIAAKPFEAENSGIFGSTRTEKVDEDVRTQRAWNHYGDEGSRAEYGYMSQAWAQPLGNLSHNKPFDAARLMGLNRAFIEGQAGTGKSFILKALSDAFEAQGLRVKRCAFTHAAANIIGGTTCHKLFGINMVGGVSEKVLRSTMADVDVILIDEMSMVPECIYNVLSQLPGHVRVYGFGDFNQHKPVESDVAIEVKSYRETSMFKSIFDYNLVVLQKQFRANVSHAAACMNFYKAAETVGVEQAMIVFPPEIRRAAEDEKLPKLNICYTNKKRRDLNCRVAEDMKMPHSSPNKRQPMAYDESRDCCYYTEKYDARKLMYILTHPSEFVDIFAKASQGQEDPLVVAMKYFANSTFDENGNGYKRVEYHRGTGGKGRWIPTGSQSLAYITRGVRHIISNQFYVDIDCVNCHPMILKQLCAKNGFDAPRLNNYILNRNMVLKEVMDKCKCDREAAKKVFLAVINGGSADYNKLGGDKCKVLREFQFEMNSIAGSFESKYPERYEQHIERRRMNGKYEGSDDGAFINMFMLEVEAQILDVVVKHMKIRKLLGTSGREVVLCADGLMVPRGPKITTELLRELEQKIVRETGFEMKLEFKPMEPRELPNGLPMPKKTKEMAPMMDPRLWDEFTHIGPGMPVIANETNVSAQYANNERFTIHMIAQGLVTLEDANNVERRVVLDEAQFRRDFRPAYAITSHKAQGATIRETYGIHEISSMGPNGAYVAITRTADPKCVVLFD